MNLEKIISLTNCTIDIGRQIFYCRLQSVSLKTCFPLHSRWAVMTPNLSMKEWLKNTGPKSQSPAAPTAIAGRCISQLSIAVTDTRDDYVRREESALVHLSVQTQWAPEV